MLVSIRRHLSNIRRVHWGLAFLFLIGTAFAHRYHAAISSITRDNDGHVEIEHRLFMHDLEPLLKASDHNLESLEDKYGENLLRIYVESHFRLRDRDGNVLNLQWVGVEWDQTYATIYQESTSAITLTQWQIENRLMMEIPTQVNTVNVHDGHAHHSLVFTSSSTLQSVDP